MFAFLLNLNEIEQLVDRGHKFLVAAQNLAGMSEAVALHREVRLRIIHQQQARLAPLKGIDRIFGTERRQHVRFDFPGLYDGAIGILAKPLAGYGERVRRHEARRPYPEIVERVRTGPPLLSPMRPAAISLFRRAATSSLPRWNHRTVTSGKASFTGLRLK